MIYYLVNINVNKEYLQDFIKATRLNAENSLKEAGVVGFDVLQNSDNAALLFTLLEIYRSPEAVLAHKETEHYKNWRDTVEKMMVEPRKGIKYQRIYPEG